MIKTPDIDIDFANRDAALENLTHVPASLIRNNQLHKHGPGVYFQNIPQDPVTQLASIPYKQAEHMGYFKIDFLNLGLYGKFHSNQHLDKLIALEPMWDMLEEQSIVDELLHLNGNFAIVQAMKPRSVDQLAMVLAIKVTSKRHLIGKSWKQVEETVWQPTDDGSYYMKRSHSVAYAIAIVAQMNLMLEQA